MKLLLLFVALWSVNSTMVKVIFGHGQDLQVKMQNLLDQLESEGYYYNTHTIGCTYWDCIATITFSKDSKCHLNTY